MTRGAKNTGDSKFGLGVMFISDDLRAVWDATGVLADLNLGRFSGCATMKITFLFWALISSLFRTILLL